MCANELLNRKLHALLLAGQSRAQSEGRDVILAGDIPITVGLQECMRQFEGAQGEVDLEAILDQLTTLPALQLAYGDGLRERLPSVAGALAVALGRALKALRPERSKPEPAEWDRLDAILEVVL